MGFLDKAKQMAEQAQQKIDEAQQQFNASQRGDGDKDSGKVRYDDQGRRIAEAAATPDPNAPEPAGDAAQASAAPDPSGPPAPAVDPNAPDPAPDAPAAAAGGANTNPDPFKPLQ